MLRLTTERLAFNPRIPVSSKVIKVQAQFSFNQAGYEENMQTCTSIPDVVSGALRENRLDISETLQALRSYQPSAAITSNRLRLMEGMNKVTSEIRNIELLLNNLEVKCNRSDLSANKKQKTRIEIKCIRRNLNKLKVARATLQEKISRS